MPDAVEHAARLLANLDGAGVIRALLHLEPRHLAALTTALETCQPGEEHAGPAVEHKPRWGEYDFGWWRLSDGRQARISWREEDGIAYVLRPGQGTEDLGYLRGPGELRKLVENLSTFDPTSLPEAIRRIRQAAAVNRAIGAVPSAEDQQVTAAIVRGYSF